MSLTNIPKPNVLEPLDFETLFTERKDKLLSLAEDYYQSSGELDKLELLKQAMSVESEPLVKLLQESAYRELLLRQRINDAAQAVMVPLATGTDLDNLGALYGMSRGKLSETAFEGDDSYRQRLMLAPKSLSTAGSKAAYKFHALSAGNQADKIELSAESENELHIIYRYNSEKNLVKDATVESPSPCDVHINVLGFDGYGQLDTEAINKIDEHLSDENIRPLGDRVTVNGPEVILYTWQLTLHLPEELEGSAQVEVVIRQVRDQLVQYVQKNHFLGKAIRQSSILGSVNSLIDGWVDLTLFKAGVEIADGQDLLVSSAQTAHYDLTGADANLTWQQKLESVIEQTLQVAYDG